MSNIKIISIINNDLEKFKIIQDIFKIIDININDINELNNLEIDRNKLLNENIKIEFLSLVKDLKKYYSSSKLTCLHKNNIYKQKWPQINLLRQILKCNNYKLLPKTYNLGYNNNGKKILKRTYYIKPLSNL